jgi:streptogramin lyase
LYDPWVRAGSRTALLAMALAVWAAACGSSDAPRACTDVDVDGHGEGCAQGPDCDDNDPSLFDGCADAGVVDTTCEIDPVAMGCPCVLGDRQACFPAATESRDVGICKVGAATCLGGAWSRCDGLVLPGVESCNRLDDDCDGFTDEGVESPCGGCNPDCRGGVWGSLAAPFDVPAPLALSPLGELTLQWHTHAARTLWIPNTDEGSVSKLDAQSAREVARYRTRGAYPIRVAVDHSADAWVLDGSFGGTAQLTKFAGDSTRCRDRAQGVARTSLGPQDVLPVGADACVLLDLAWPQADDPRTLSLDGAVAPDGDPAGNVWLGLAGTRALAQLEGSTGRELARYDLGDFKPLASAFDPFGILWLIDRAGALLRFDPADPAAINTWTVPYACYTLEALSIDAQGRLFMSGFGCERVFSYDPARGLWRTLAVPELLSPRGIIALDGSTSWLAYDSGQIARLGRDPLGLGAAQSLASEALSPFETVALTADGYGQVWAISTQGGADGAGLATRFDPDVGRITAQVSLGMAPRAGGDFSGYASGGEYEPEGSASHVFGGCGREGRDMSLQVDTQWRRLRVSAAIGLGASVVVSVRRAESDDALAEQEFQRIAELPKDGAVFPLALADGGVVEVRLDLHSPVAIGAPRIARVGLEWECPGPE